MKFRKIFNFILCLCLLGLLLIGLLFACMGRLDINEYENRYAEKIGKPSLSSYLSGEFQDSMETGLADQLPFAIALKTSYNQFFSDINTWVFNKARSFYAPADMPDVLLTDEEMDIKLAELEKEEAERIAAEQQIIARGIRRETIATPEIKYVNMGEGVVYVDNIVYTIHPAEDDKAAYEARMENLNEKMAENPGPDYCMYYNESCIDVQFETGQRSGIWELLTSLTDIPEENRACFMIHSFREYDTYYYKTDHHWNYKGSYKAYKNILKWLLPYEEPLEPVGTWDLGLFSGSMASGALSNFSEMMTVYEFNYPELQITINGAPASDYGGKEAYIALAKEGKSCGQLTYGLVYGQDNGEVVFENESSPNGSLLIIGDSYDNAIVKLLACHFKNVTVIDQRNYKAQMGKDFVFSDYIASHDFDRVLFMGSSSYWNKSLFYLN